MHRVLNKDEERPGIFAVVLPVSFTSLIRNLYLSRASGSFIRGSLRPALFLSVRKGIGYGLQKCNCTNKVSLKKII